LNTDWTVSEVINLNALLGGYSFFQSSNNEERPLLYYKPTIHKLN